MKKDRILILWGFLIVFFCVTLIANANPVNFNVYSKKWNPKRYVGAGKTSILNDSVILNKILDKLFNLTEVRKKNKFIDSLTNHAKGVSMRVMKSPDSLTKYYWIAVGYNNDFRFETYYNFYVWPKNLYIKYLDPMTGRLLTLEEWRKKTNRRRG